MPEESDPTAHIIRLSCRWFPVHTMEVITKSKEFGRWEEGVE